MLNPNCCICTEVFTANHEVFATPCGHIFHNQCLMTWFKRSNTCPQCRNKCTSRTTIRIYFNNGNLDDSRIDDSNALQEQLVDIKLQHAEARKEAEARQKELDKLTEANKKAVQTITGMQEEIERKDFIIQAHSEQIKILKREAKIVTELRKEIEGLSTKLRAAEGLTAIISSNTLEADKLAKRESDPKVLRLWVTSLKRELRQSENKKADLRNSLKTVQSDCRSEIALRKKRDEVISRLESENYELNAKLKLLEEQEILQLSTKPKVLDQIIKTERRSTLSPSIKDNIKQIQDSNSPYLNIKASSVGLAPILKRHPSSGLLLERTTLSVENCNGRKITSNGATKKNELDLSEKYSIFKKPRLGGLTNMATTKTNYVFNGLGGSEKVDPFIRDEPNSTENKFLLSTKSQSKKLDERLKTARLRNFKFNK